MLWIRTGHSYGCVSAECSVSLPGDRCVSAQTPPPPSPLTLPQAVAYAVAHK